MLVSLIISLLPVADSLSVLENSEMRRASIWNVTKEEKSVTSPLRSPFGSFTEASVSWKGRDSKDAVLLEEGLSQGEGIVDIKTLVRMDSLSAVSGEVSYHNGIRRGVCWNSSSDYFTVFPYVVADSVGGNTRFEEYAFSGAYSQRKGRFLYGLKASYRALHEYRQVDPRPRNIVSDFSVRASAGYSLLPAYSLEMGMAYRRYSQSQNMAFYNQRGANSSLFHLTGLGSHFARFAGTNSATTSTRYVGNGIEANMFLAPRGLSGWRAGLYYSLLGMVHALPNLNEAPYTRMYTREAGLSGSYLSLGGDLSWSAGAHASLEWRRGRESVLDNGFQGRYEELMQFVMYRSHSLDAGLDGRVEYKNWTLEADAAYHMFDASYAYPSRAEEYSSLVFHAKGSYRKQVKKWLFSAGIDGGRKQALGGGLSLPAEFTMPAMSSHLEEQHNRLTDSYLTMGGEFHLERSLSKSFSLSLEMRARCAFYDSGNRIIYYITSIGFIF